ncbi:MAG: O-antigen polymerase [Elusimicrobia bacterium]|nr:MAG: O-antigen polymerase [Elusimicrobiota bacterium]KAF0156566.1 MAG: O-antigen polymerase [Elusimicrobiota bacterium]
MAKNTPTNYEEYSDLKFAPGVPQARKAIWIWLPLLYLLISDSFYLRTYDSAQVKITLLQMGGFSLLGMWLGLLVLEGRKAFSRSDFVFLAPFFAYLAYMLVGFLRLPYPGPSIDDLVRYTIYMSVGLIVIREFGQAAIERLTKVLLIAAYIAVLYGLVQFIDTRFFPPKEVGPGLDPFVWRGAFGIRVFSTYGNPNFFGNFLVLILPIAVTQFMKTRSLYLLPLIFLNLLCLYGTRTKGAWLGFGISFFLFSVFYAYFFLRERLKIGKTAFLAIAAVFPLTAVGVVYHLGNPASYSFRIATWLSTWEVIESKPLIGLGVDAFMVTYPAYRRPVIFHIEGKHNTETDHAENEHLEQWMDNGIIGFGIYLWLIVFVVTIGLRGMGTLTANLKGARPPPTAYDLLGYITALLGMLIHNFVDVSMRFVSSGVFLGLLPAIIINLARGQALWEIHYKGEPEQAEAPRPAGPPAWLLWAARIILAAAVTALFYIIVTQFAELQGPLRNHQSGGESLLWFIAWTVLLACAGFIAWSYLKIAFMGRSVLAALVMAVSLAPVWYFWGWFRADVYHNMAIFFSKQGRWDDALSYYQRVHSLNPYFIMPYYFTGNVFNDRFNMTRQYRSEWGDRGEEPRDDYERAMDSYEHVRSIAPNYVQMHHQVGLLFMKMHDHTRAQGREKEAQDFLDRALVRFDLSEKLDPVFPFNYYRKAQIYTSRRQYEAAEREYLNNLNAWQCHVPGHRHETPEAYTNLGNLYYMMGRPRDAAENFASALRLNPGFEPALRNYQALTGRRSP